MPEQIDNPEHHDEDDDGEQTFVQPIPGPPPLLVQEVPEVAKLTDIISVETQGRARNGRIAYILAVALLLVSIVAGVAIRGWSGATSALDTRNHAVQTLTENAQRQVDIDDCQDRAFAFWLDQVLKAQDIPAGVLTGYYAECNRTDGKQFRP